MVTEIQWTGFLSILSSSEESRSVSREGGVEPLWHAACHGTRGDHPRAQTQEFQHSGEWGFGATWFCVSDPTYRCSVCKSVTIPGTIWHSLHVYTWVTLLGAIQLQAMSPRGVLSHLKPTAEAKAAAAHILTRSVSTKWRPTRAIGCYVVLQMHDYSLRRWEDEFPKRQAQESTASGKHARYHSISGN